MRPSLTALLLALAALLLPAPVQAQDGCGCGDGCDDGCSVIEESDEEDEKAPNLSGLSEKKKGGTRDDVDAPKVKQTLQQQINAAIKRGVKWLKKKQQKDGSWGHCHAPRSYGGGKGGDCYFSGPTSFSLYTLAKCDVPKKAPVVKKGLQWLRDKYRHSQVWNGGGSTSGKQSMVTYECSSLIMMLEATYQRSAKLTGKHKKKKLETSNPARPPRKSKIPKDEWQWMHQSIVFLTKGRAAARNKRGAGVPGFKGCQNPSGLWRYGQANPQQQDASATQFVLLGLRAASQAGYPVKPEIWLKALGKSGNDGVRKFQAGPGFAYQPGQQANDGMTAANLASMIICREQLQLTGTPVPSWVDPAIENGLKHFDTLFDANKNGGSHHGGVYHYYYLYTVERVGDMLKRKEFNGKDWYVRGARLLLANQTQEGSFPDSTCMNPKDTLGTCFALLFLKRATPAVVTGARD